MLALFYGTAYADAVEPVKNLVVRVQANLVLLVYESGMEILSLYEIRKGYLLRLDHNGLKPFQLRFLLSYNINLVSRFQP